MADGNFEPYHVPQQTRRDKLRIDHNHHEQDQQLFDHVHELPFYNPSLIFPNSDLIARAKLNLVKEGTMASSCLPLNLNPNCSDTSSNSNSIANPFVYTPPLSLELNLQRYGGGSSVLCSDHSYIVRGGSGVNHEVSTSCVPLGPFTGYASILKGSRFLKPAQQLLEEFCVVGRSFNGHKVMDGEGLMEPPGECMSGVGSESDYNCGDDVGGESRSKKSRLNSMLNEVYRRYKLYYQQLQAVVASFECVAGLGNAAPYANFALKTLSKHFRSLKILITDHLQFTVKAQGQLILGKNTDTRVGNMDSVTYCRGPIQNFGFIEHHQPVWRPQRGLPERAVTVLRAWLFEHFLHPYPTDQDKIILAKQTGLSRNQVSNWFINARVRLWKPMVEEIHMLETRQGQKASQEGNNRLSEQVALSNSAASSNPSTSTQREPRDGLSKRTRNEYSDLSTGNGVPLNLSYNCLSSNPHAGIGVSMASGSSNVSLTLGLQQNNGISLSEPYPINAAQRFGLDHPGASSEAYIMAGFEAQNRQFGRNVIGGQLLHDFVG